MLGKNGCLAQGGTHSPCALKRGTPVSFPLACSVRTLSLSRNKAAGTSTCFMIGVMVTGMLAAAPASTTVCSAEAGHQTRRGRAPQILYQQVAGVHILHRANGYRPCHQRARVGHLS